MADNANSIERSNQVCYPARALKIFSLYFKCHNNGKKQVHNQPLK